MVEFTQIDIENWRAFESGTHPETGIFGTRVLATIKEIEDEKVYDITYHAFPGQHLAGAGKSKGTRTVRFCGTLTQAQARVIRRGGPLTWAQRWAARECSSSSADGR